MCELLTIAGQSLEAASQKSRERVGTYFGVMDRWQKSKALPSRIRFMVKDVVELRRSKWIPRREQLQVGPALSAQWLCMSGIGVKTRKGAATGSTSLLADNGVPVGFAAQYALRPGTLCMFHHTCMMGLCCCWHQKQGFEC